MADQDSRPTWVKNLGLFSVIVADLLGYTGAGIGLGYLAMSKLGWPWWVLLITTSAGLTLAMYRLYQMSKKNLF